MSQSSSEYRPWDRDEKLGPPPWSRDDPKVKAWEAAHGHDARLKCYSELGCGLVEQGLEAERDRYREALERIRDTDWRAFNYDPQLAGRIAREALEDGRS